MVIPLRCTHDFCTDMLRRDYNDSSPEITRQNQAPTFVAPATGRQPSVLWSVAPNVDSIKDIPSTVLSCKQIPFFMERINRAGHHKTLLNVRVEVNVLSSTDRYNGYRSIVLLVYK